MSAGEGGFPVQGPRDAFVPREYHQLLRGPAYRPWRPLASLLIVLAGVVSLLAVAALAAMVMYSVPSLREEMTDIALDGTSSSELSTVPLLLANNLLLAGLIPVTMAATIGAHGWRPGFLSSVAGRLRWGFLLRCAAIVGAVQVAALVVVFAFGGRPSVDGRHVVALFLVVALTTPLQAAGEEYLFRGWIMQNVGSWIPAPLPSMLVSGVVSAAVFAMAHGRQDFWLSLDRFAFGLLAAYLVWLTGGLEAAIAAHAVNNLVVFFPLILSGGVSEALHAESATVEAVVLDLVTMLVVGGLITFYWRRRPLARRFQPPVRWG